MSMSLALVEDDQVLRENYADILSAQGYDVAAYATAESARSAFAGDLPDLVLLDLSLDGDREAGFTLCEELRTRSLQLPIIFLTSFDADVDRIAGMEVGADDYLTKDVGADYLVARIQALFRRQREITSALRSEGDRVPSNAGLKLDVDASLATWRDQRLQLSLTQFWILQALYEARGDCLRHHHLMEAARLFVEPNTIVAHVNAIRKAFRRIDPAFDRIRTERGIGYRWLVQGNGPLN